MATFTEAAVKVAIEINRHPVSGDTVIISGYSVASDGTPIRSQSGFDVTSFLTQQQKDAATFLLDAAENYYKNHWEIP